MIVPPIPGAQVPSLVQFRLGAAKGVAYVDPRLEGRCIEIRDSQRKLALPSPTPQQCVFEVCKFGDAATHGAELNSQASAVLVSFFFR